MGQVVVQGIGIDLAVQAQHDPLLQRVEGDVRLERERFAGDRMLVEQALDDPVTDNAGLDDLLDVLGLETRVEDTLGPEDHDRPLLAEAVAAGLDHRHLVGEAALGQRLVDGLAQRDAAGGMTGRAGADADLGLGVVGEVGVLVGGGFERRIDLAARARGSWSPCRGYLRCSSRRRS